MNLDSAILFWTQIHADISHIMMRCVYNPPP